MKGVHNVDFSGVRDDKCHTGVGESRVRTITVISSNCHHIIKNYHIIKLLSYDTRLNGSSTSKNCSSIMALLLLKFNILLWIFVPGIASREVGISVIISQPAS